MKSLIYVIEGLLDSDTKSSDRNVASSFGSEGGILNTEYHLYGRFEKPYDVDIQNGVMTITPPVGEIGEYAWEYRDSNSYTIPKSIGKRFDIHTLQFKNLFSYTNALFRPTDLDGKNFVSKLVAWEITLYSVKEVSNIELVSKRMGRDSRSTIFIKNDYSMQISLKNVKVDTDILLFSTDGTDSGKLPIFNNVSGRANIVNIYGRDLLDDIVEKFNRLMDKDYVCEFELNGYKQVGHIPFETCLQAFSDQSNPPKYRFYNCPFWFDNLSLSDFVDISRLKPEIVRIYDKKTQIIFCRNLRLYPIDNVAPISYDIMGVKDRYKFIKMFPVTKDGYRMIVAKRN